MLELILFMIFVWYALVMIKGKRRQKEMEDALADPDFAEEIKHYAAQEQEIKHEVKESICQENRPTTRSKAIAHTLIDTPEPFFHEVEKPKPLVLVPWQPKTAASAKEKQATNNPSNRSKTHFGVLDRELVKNARLDTRPESRNASFEERSVARPYKKLQALQAQMIAYEIFSGPKSTRQPIHRIKY